MLSRNVRVGIVCSLLLAVIVMTVLALYGDFPRMITALANFHWQLLPLILGFTLFNYAGRFVKWQYYLKRLRISVKWYKSLLIFVSGLSMAITPGKVGELLKSYLLKRTTGEPVSRTSPIIVAERLTDGIAMLGLAASGLALYRLGWQILLLLLAAGLTGILIIQNRPLALRILNHCEQLPGMQRITHGVRTFYESSYVLLQWQPLLLAICIGLISWSGECGALYFVYNGLGIAGSFDLFMKAMFILAVSSLIGSATGLPGGLGTADSSMVGLTRILVSTSATLGGAATLLIRLCTLWFGLVLGAIALIAYRIAEGAGTAVELRDGLRDQRPGIGTIISKENDASSVILASARTGETVV